MANILALDDNLELCKLIRTALERDGHRVETRQAGGELTEALCRWADCILLDVMMPGEDGFAVCRRIRSLTEVPILFLSARTDEAAVLEGLGIGADDFLSKPFRVAELRARVAAHLRRQSRTPAHRMVRSGVAFDLTARSAAVEGKALPLTREETEELIRKALTFSAEPPERRQARTQKFLPLYGVSVVLGLVETAAVWAVGLAGTEGAMMLLIMNVIFGIVYGAYTLFWMPETLPRYYDENHVCNFAQGAFHMHIPGVYYNNRNWLHVLKAMRVWCVVSMLLTPLCTAAAVVFEQATGWQVWGAVLIGYIASLFGAIVIPAKKYQ